MQLNSVGSQMGFKSLRVDGQVFKSSDIKHFKFEKEIMYKRAPLDRQKCVETGKFNVELNLGDSKDCHRFSGLTPEKVDEFGKTVILAMNNNKNEYEIDTKA